MPLGRYGARAREALKAGDGAMGVGILGALTSELPFSFFFFAGIATADGRNGIVQSRR